MQAFHTNKIIRISFVFVSLLLWQSCVKEYNIELPAQTQGGDEVDPNLEALIANTPSIPYNLMRLELSNGQTIQQFLDSHPDFKQEFDQIGQTGGRLKVIDWSNQTPDERLAELQSSLFNSADFYCDIVHKKPEWSLGVPKDGTSGRPAQPFGLAYVYGGGRLGHDPELNREKPARYTDSKTKITYPSCPEDVTLYGMDCSGFVYRVFTKAKYTIPSSLTIQADEMKNLSFWKAVLGSNTDKLAGIRVSYVTGKDQTGVKPVYFSKYSTQLQDNTFYKPGDIIFWHTAGYTATHMGIVFKNDIDGKMHIYQSNGITHANGDTSPCINGQQHTAKGNCASNYLCPGRGVHTVSLSFIKQMTDDVYISIIRFETNLVGNTGNPRFNLQFTNPDNVDLDLYVKDPNGEVIYYNNKTAYRSQGQLDVDCLCDQCPQGPNENIFWPLNLQSPIGKYEFWINYYGFCQQAAEPSSYIVRVTNDSKPNDPILFTATGILSIKDDDSPHWIYDTSTGKVTPK